MNKKNHYLTGMILTIFVWVTFTLSMDIARPVKAASANQLVESSIMDFSRNERNLVAFSPDGDILANVDADGLITLWNVTSGLAPTTLQNQPANLVTGIAFRADGKILASVGKDSIKLWDIGSGQEQLSIPLVNTNSAIVQVAFSSDGEHLAGVTLENEILLWNLKTGFSKSIKAEQDVTVDQITFSPDGKYLVSANNGVNSHIKLWDAVSGALYADVRVDAFVNEFEFSPDSNVLASVGQDGLITLLDLNSAAVKRILDTKAEITEVAFSPDSKTLATGSGGNDPKVMLWNPVTGELVYEHPAESGSSVTQLFYSPDGGLLASIGEDSLISLFDVPTGELKKLLVGPSDVIIKAAFNSKQPSLAAIGKDGGLFVWDLLTGVVQQVFQIPTALSAPIADSQALIAPKAASNISSQLNVPNTVVAAQPDGSSQIVGKDNAGTSKKRRAQNWKGIRALAISQDGLEIGVGGEDGTVRILNKNGSQRWKVSGHHGRTITGISFRGKTKGWVSVGIDTEIKIWDDTGKNLNTFYGPEQPIHTVAVSPDGRFIATAGEDTKVFLYDAETNKLSMIFTGHVDFVNGLSFSPDGQFLASAGAEGNIILWDVKAGKKLRALLGHSDQVNAVAFSPDGALLASASADSTVILWDLSSGEQIKTLNGNQGGVRTVAFSPDGKKLVSAGDGTKMLVWDTATGQLQKQIAGPPASINALAFSPDGDLHAASENSEISEFNTDTGTEVNTIVVPASSTVDPQSSISEALSLAMSPNSGRLNASHYVAQSNKSAKPSNTNLSSIINQLLNWVISPAIADIPPAQLEGPILLITSSTPGVPSNPNFSAYYTEILRTEGFNEFVVAADISTVTTTTLNAYDVVILAPMTLTSVQVTMITDWVTNAGPAGKPGGNLIAMKPDKQLAGLLGLTDAATTPLENGYLLVNTSVSPGKGIVGETVQFHGTADRYTLNGATAIATLFSNATTATSNPAVTLRSVGTAGGKAAAFTYDLAKSIVYARQGNPLWATQDRDIDITPATLIRSDDKYYGDASFDPQPDWVDLNKAAIPQADEQQRLLANLILEMNHGKKPLPRFWYFPHGKPVPSTPGAFGILKAALIMTGDDHGNGGTAGRFDQFKAKDPVGCSVANWECVRGTSYIYPSTLLTNDQALAYTADGFEVGLHINTACGDYNLISGDPQNLETIYSQQISEFTTKYTSPLLVPKTMRHHCIAWSDWVTGATIQKAHAIRFDADYYFWPPAWVNNRPGNFTSSAMPMRFADLSGNLIDVYQAVTHMTDESGQVYPFTVDALLDKAVGVQEYYGAYTINAHTDFSTLAPDDHTASNTIALDAVDSALARGVPIVSSVQMMNWLDGRDNSSFGSLAWDGTHLTFTVTPGTGAGGLLQAMLPMHSSATGNLASLNGPSGPIPVTTDTIKTIKGVEYAFFSAAAGTYTATYQATPLSITTTSLPGGTVAIPYTATLAATGGTLPYTWSITSGALPPGLSLAPNTGAIIGTPTSAGTANFTVQVSDSANPSATEAKPLSITIAAATNVSVWSSATVPGQVDGGADSPVELGVKFRSDAAGAITGIRFYKASTNTGEHVGNLWSCTDTACSTGTRLATAIFSGETASGWQQVSFPSPVSITANTVYVASYHANNGHYSADLNYFSGAGVDAPPLHLLASGGITGGNGVYTYGTTSAFPAQTFNSSNYWVDVVFNAGAAASLAVTTTSLPGGAVGLAYSASLAASGGTPPYTWSLTSGTLPNGLSLNPGTGAITGTPTTAGTSNFTVQVTDSAVPAVSVTKPLSITITTGSGGCASPPNPIVAENCQTTGVQPQSVWDVSGAGDSTIQGFATDISVNKGGTVNFKITSSAAYRLDIYRMGYYGGNGARLVATVPSLPAQSQPACLTDATGLIDCGNWAPSASWSVPANVTSGIYFARAVRSDTGGASHIVFIVRDDSSTSQILFQTADTTWQAYNSQGGNSLYTGTGPGTGGSANGRAYKVSYNRPFNTRVAETETWLFNGEYPMVRWLEANGYDVSYFTGVDADRNGAQIKNHKIYLTNGHDEYWSGAQRDNVEAARNVGVNLALFSGNAIFWKTRWENSIDGSGTAYRTLVCYKETHDYPNNPDPTTIWTGTWRDPRGKQAGTAIDGGNPENALSGTFFRINGPYQDTFKVPAEDGKMRLWRNTSVASLGVGQTATLAPGTLGAEVDVDDDNGSRPAGLFGASNNPISTSTLYAVDSGYGSIFGAPPNGTTPTNKVTLYRHLNPNPALSALVFSTGSYQWSWGLDSTHDRRTLGSATDVSMQQATVNLFADMGVQPGSLQSGLVAATASTDATPPTSTITAPTAGANFALGSQITISGTATDTGGVVGGVEVSVDGGKTWHPATGRGNWSYSWTTSVAGTVTLKSRAVDDSGNLETPAFGVSVTIGPALQTITVTPANPAIPGGTTQQFTATGAYVGGATQNITSQVTWTSATPAVATINASGLASGLSTGTSTISATLGSVNGSTVLTVQGGTLQSITVTPANPTIAIGATSQFTATGNYSGGGALNLTSQVTWTSATPTVASINATGLATGVSAGTSNITATLSGVTGSTVLTVQSAPLAITTPSLANGTVGQAYSASLAASGGITPYTWSLASGSLPLPAGLTLNPSSGVISGTPTTAGTSNFTVQVSDTSTPTAQTASKVLGITVQPVAAGIAIDTVVGGGAGVVFRDARGTVTTPAFNTAGANELLLAFVASDGPNTSGGQTATVSGAGLTWTLVWRTNTRAGTSEVWRAFATSALSNATVQSVPLQANYDQSLTVVALTGASGVGVSNGANAASGAPSVSLTTTAANAWVFGVGNDWDGAVARTLGTGQTMVHQWVDTGAGDTFWVQRLSNAVAVAGTVATINDTAPTADRWNLTAVEVVPGTPVPPPTLTSIAVTPMNSAINVGATQQFTATGTYSDSSTQNLTSLVAWTSASPLVATINAAGLATGVGTGTSIITATLNGVPPANSTLTVQSAPLGITTASLPGGIVNTAYSATLAASGGTLPYTWSITAGGSLPSGLTLNTSTGVISGTPTATGTFNFTVQVSDSTTPTPQTVSKVLSITIANTVTSTGFMSPTANAPVTSSAGDNNGFQTNPTNAYADGDPLLLGGGFAVDTNSGTGTGTSCTGTGKDKHVYYNYGISLPVGAAIKGIEVRLDAKVDSTANTPNMCVQLSWDGGTTWTAAKSTATLTTTEATYVLGGAADLWGRTTWNISDLLNTSFRVRIIDVASSTGANARDFSLDWVAVRVSYQ
ncbi:N,N-dimethylformamidase beta subunit family domain-containing protein [Methylomicrobium lacus]|uniref:N,N-dimethylformamidase beta subunit family domain-containing protein n=1 Tax=Methylomicrobium lacus TaxID=136992 RepID=UPI0035A898B6